jgi:3',5'-nucleoside bisphosphate phosphatase
MKNYDLHSHSTASDGSLNPAQLINLAKKLGVDCMALTDHDGIDGLEEAKQQAKIVDLEFIPGIELSVTWQKFTIHIVGLNINTAYIPLIKGTQQLKSYRLWRAEQISKGLDECGIKDALTGAQQYSSGKMIGRMHFANFLVDNGYCKDIRTVFKKFLVKNKPGYIHGQWASLEDVISWINGAGGIAVVAHPGRYPFKNKKLKMLLNEFIEMGGQAIEVVSGSHSVQDVSRMTSIAQEFDLYASVGSDFHNPDVIWNKLGKLAPLSEQCTPVWKAWEH